MTFDDDDLASMLEAVGEMTTVGTESVYAALDPVELPSGYVEGEWVQGYAMTLATGAADDAGAVEQTVLEVEGANYLVERRRDVGGFTELMLREVAA